MTILKDDFYLIVDLSLTEALFSVPLIVAFSFGYAFLTALKEVTFQSVFSVVFYMGLISVPCFALKYVGRNAAFSVMKKRAHNEGCFITAQVFSSVRSSFVKSAFNGLIAGLFAFIAAVGSVYLLFVSSTFVKWVATGALIVIFAVFYCAAQYFMASENFYDLTFFAQLKNSLAFSLMYFPSSLLFFLLTAGVKFTLSLFAPWLFILAIAIYSLVLNGLSVTVATLYAHKVFDDNINRVNYPQYVGKGLKKDV